MNNLTKESLIEICKKQKINYQEKNNIELLKNKVLKYSINFLNNKEKKENNKNKNQEIQITRHARSCNNEGFWKRDPSIINRGIIQTIIFANINRTKFTSNYVYVSCLLRTWITAILLYSIGQTELPLHISPYLKEKHTKFIKHLPNSGKKIDKGNFPESFKTSIRKLLRFLNSVESLLKNKTYLLKNKTYLLKNKTYLLNNKTNLNFSLPTKIKIIIESKEKHNYLLYIYKNKTNNKKFITYPILNDIPIDPILNVRHKSYYQLDGKLGKFLNWVKKKHTFKDKIHVIAHSRLMKEYLVGLDYIDELHKNNFTENNAENNPKNNPKNNKRNNTINTINTKNTKNTRNNQTNTESNQSVQNLVINTSEFLPKNNAENNTDNIDTLNKIQEYISGTNCSMIQLFPDKGCKVSKGYDKTEYTGTEYENYSSVLLGKQKFGYNLCYDKNNKLKKN